MDWLTYWITYEDEELEKLRQKGFSSSAIVRLCHLRKGYGHNEMDKLPLDSRRLEFVRWLVARGKLTDWSR
ncbi:MAG TPA: hypothetical protein VH593_18370 [Ktedonobacteraceae bacterium]|jgi:hypothetical protein